MERSKQRAYDYALVIVLGIIIVTGLVILYSTSAYNGKLKFQDSFYYLKKQIFATLLGIAGMWIIARVDYHVWKKWSVPGYLVSVPKDGYLWVRFLFNRRNLQKLRLYCF